MSRMENSVMQLVGLLIVPAIVGTFSIAFYLSVADMDAESALYPKLAIAGLLILLLIEVGISISQWRNLTHEAVNEITFSSVSRRWRRALYTIALALGFMVLISVLGFYVALVPFLVVFLLALGIRSPITIGGFSIGLLVASYLLFEAALSVPLPEGIFG